MSTAQTIPTEVIQQIFALFSTTFTAHDPALFPWFLGHVCSRWRSIFLDMTTEFWHTIHIAFHWEDTSKPAKNLIQFFLERDPTAPFSFYIRFPGALAKSQPHVRDHMRQILEMLVDESMRWQRISFSVEGGTPMTHLLPLTRAKDRLPLLQKLRLSSWGGYSAPLPLLDVFQSAPSLNVIQMSNPGNWKFDWSTLKVVEVNQLGSGTCDFIPALSQMTNLERLRITSAFRGAVQSDSVVLLPRLAALKCGPSWLAFLRAPALTALTLYVDEESNTSDVVPSFLLRSSCNVLHLCITGGEAAAAVEVVRHTPRITRLELLDVDGVERALEKLIISSDPAQPRELLARHLLSLHIRSDFEDDIQCVMPRLISSRTGAAGCKRLRELGVSIPQFNLSADTIGNLIALCKERGIHYIDYQRNVSYT